MDPMGYISKCSLYAMIQHGQLIQAPDLVDGPKADSSGEEDERRTGGV